MSQAEHHLDKESQMGTHQVMKQSFLASMEEDWKSLAEFYDDNKDRVLLPLTISEDTALHMAVYSKDEKLLKYLLDAAYKLRMHAPGDHEHPINITNSYGDTLLHLAAATGNMEAVKLLLKESRKISGDQLNALLLKKNKNGETPLFRAAAFGQTKIVRYLIEQPAQMSSDKQLLVAHIQRVDFQSILHLAVLGESFDTALLLLKSDSSLSHFQDSKGRTCLYVLASIPSAFKSGYSMGIFRHCLYSYLPVDQDEANNGKEDDDGRDHSRDRDLEAVEITGCRRNFYSRFRSYVYRGLKTINQSVCRFFFGWPIVKRIWEDKRKHNLALELARVLIKNGVSWDQQITVQGYQVVSIGSSVFGPQPRGGGGDEEKGIPLNPHPLLLATKTGALEIVYEILKEYPQAVEFVSETGRNILHVAVMFRRKEIFTLLKSNRILLARMSSVIDINGYTLLHQVADNTYYSGGSKPGPALQLQEEMDWFKRVKKVIPSYYAKHRDSKHDMTAEELFGEKHKDQLREAQKWIKETAQSCSAVAVLIATIVFAAAYTVPGGFNEEGGNPILLRKPFFLFFTTMDVIALAGSLTSVVMFLSILTSSVEYEDFHYSIPRKLTLGFTLLFVSLMTTMLAFAATIMLIIHELQKYWIAVFISVAAFVPVSIFALMQFHLYSTYFLRSMKGIFLAIRLCYTPFLFCKKKRRQSLFRTL